MVKFLYDFVNTKLMQQLLNTFLHTEYAVSLSFKVTLVILVNKSKSIDEYTPFNTKHTVIFLFGKINGKRGKRPPPSVG